MILEKRSVAMVIVLSLVTCGFYLLYWYYKVYQELTFLTGKSPTDNDYGLDLLLVIITCGVWGVYVDYKISLQIFEYQKNQGLFAQDSSMVAVVLDVVGYISGYFTGIVSSAIHQDLINGLIDHASGKPPSRPTEGMKPSDQSPPSPWQ
ncbi:MAG: DUF4234 domain-containing protein [Leptospiraceae bacterium]